MKIHSQLVRDSAEAVTLAARGTVSAIEGAWLANREAHIVLTGGRTGLAFVEELDQMLAELDQKFSEVDHTQSHSASSLSTSSHSTSSDSTSPSHHIVNIWFSDERFVDFESEDRNDTTLKSAFEKSHEFLAFFRSLPPSEATLSESADGYDSVLKSEIGTRNFDVVVLSMGEDGHIASCFPGDNAVLQSPLDATAVRNSPKPPSERVSITLSRLGMSHLTYIFALGEGKSSALRDTLAGASSMPITLLRQNSPSGDITLITDITL